MKALLKQWPKTLVLELDGYDKTVNVYKRDPKEPSCACARAASFRKPTLFL